MSLIEETALGSLASTSSDVTSPRDFPQAARTRMLTGSYSNASVLSSLLLVDFFDLSSCSMGHEPRSTLALTKAQKPSCGLTGLSSEPVRNWLVIVAFSIAALWQVSALY